MLTNILLGLILGIVITSFIILNNKINKIKFNTKFIIDILTRINQFVEGNNIVVNNIQDKFNKQVLVNNEHFEIINSSINDKFKALNYNDDYIKERLNTFDTDTQNLIIAEHRCTRNEIKKQAKISSKIKSQSKTNNNINKQ